jgi:signal transduction histidine kinase
VDFRKGAARAEDESVLHTFQGEREQVAAEPPWGQSIAVRRATALRCGQASWCRSASSHGSGRDPVRVAFYRITQEATNNVIKHADASHLTVDLTGDDEEIRLLVTDDGAGFDVDESTNGAMGLDIMRERAAAIGADLAVVSGPNAGTSVTVAWTPNGAGDR